MDIGYRGLVPAKKFITGDDLAKRVGLTAGVAQFSETDWVHLTVDGVTTLFPMKPIRHSVSWDDLDKQGLVYGQEVEIGGVKYRCRLFKGANSDPQAVGADGAHIGYNIDSVKQSEWNRIMYALHSGVHTVPDNNNVGSFAFGTLAQFSDGDLHLHYSFGNGTYCWTQEVSSYGSSRRVDRGGLGVSRSDGGSSSHANTSYGWRPLLEAL